MNLKSVKSILNAIIRLQNVSVIKLIKRGFEIYLSKGNLKMKTPKARNNSGGNFVSRGTGQHDSMIVVFN